MRCKSNNRQNDLIHCVVIQESVSKAINMTKIKINVFYINIS
jgi:hypothetical protein